MSELASNVVHKLADEVAPELASELVPELASDAVPELASDSVPELVFDVAFEVASGLVSRVISVPELVPVVAVPISEPPSTVDAESVAKVEFVLVGLVVVKPSEVVFVEGDVFAVSLFSAVLSSRLAVDPIPLLDIVSGLCGT